MTWAPASSQGDRLEGFEDFYRHDYRLLIKVVMAAGATPDEADEAVDQTMEEVLRRWRQLEHPRGFARRAVVTNFVKRKMRDRERLVRTIEGGHVTPQCEDDRGLNVWEDKQWVDQLLERLPPAQRDVMRYVVDGLRPSEIADLLGKTPEAIRKNLQLARERLRPLVRDDAHPSRTAAGESCETREGGEADEV